MKKAPRAKSGETYRFAGGRVEVNFDTYQVNVDGHSVRLTALEMKLLRYFIEHEGSVVTRAELLENVWGMARIPSTRTVDNFIVNLRKYFEPDPSQPRHFLSVRGTGYRFVPKAKRPFKAPAKARSLDRIVRRSAAPPCAAYPAQPTNTSQRTKDS